MNKIIALFSIFIFISSSVYAQEDVDFEPEQSSNSSVASVVVFGTIVSGYVGSIHFKTADAQTNSISNFMGFVGLVGLILYVVVRVTTDTDLFLSNSDPKQIERELKEIAKIGNLFSKIRSTQYNEVYTRIAESVDCEDCTDDTKYLEAHRVISAANEAFEDNNLEEMLEKFEGKEDSQAILHALYNAAIYVEQSKEKK